MAGIVQILKAYPASMLTNFFARFKRTGSSTVNPIASKYPKDITGVYNTVILILSIPQSKVEAVLPSPLKLLPREIFTPEFLALVGNGNWPVMLEAGQDEAVQLAKYTTLIKPWDFMTTKLSIPGVAVTGKEADTTHESLYVHGVCLGSYGAVLGAYYLADTDATLSIFTPPTEAFTPAFPRYNGTPVADLELDLASTRKLSVANKQKDILAEVEISDCADDWAAVVKAECARWTNSPMIGRHGHARCTIHVRSWEGDITVCDKAGFSAVKGNITLGRQFAGELAGEYTSVIGVRARSTFMETLRVKMETVEEFKSGHHRKA